MSGKSKFWQWIDHRVRVTITDKRMMVGTFIGFDKHLNMVLADTEEHRLLKPKKKGDPQREIKRPMGLMILRGDSIVSITAEQAPNMNLERKMDITSLGPGKSQPIVRPGNFGKDIGFDSKVPDNLEGLGQIGGEFMNA